MPVRRAIAAPRRRLGERRPGGDRRMCARAASAAPAVPPSAGDSRRGRRRRWPEMRLRACVPAPRLGGCLAMRAAVVWRACRQRRRTPPLQFTIFVGEPAGAPAGAQSSPESRPCELRSRLGNSGALVSLVPLDFKSDRQTGSIARSPTTSTWQFVIVKFVLYILLRRAAAYMYPYVYGGMKRPV